MSVMLLHCQEMLFFSFTPDQACSSISPKEFHLIRPNNSSVLPTSENNEGPSRFPDRTLQGQKNPSLKYTITPPKSRRFAPTFHNPRQE
ncbi:hypothetical protein TNCV_4994101 [Trichonephila clavipes]|nr:hypothetical protein TNCV_4994101 [Trichonephila clavipes]